MVKLDIGSGGWRYAPDYTTVDLYAAADVRAPMLNLPYESDSIEEIWCSHAFEHVPFTEVKKVLAEFKRVLKPGTSITITVPDFDWIAQYWLSNKSNTFGSWSEMVVFGNQEHEGEYHKSAWSLEKLKSVLLEAGFSINSIDYLWDHEVQSIRAIAVKG